MLHRWASLLLTLLLMGCATASPSTNGDETRSSLAINRLVASSIKLEGDEVYVVPPTMTLYAIAPETAQVFLYAEPDGGDVLELGQAKPNRVWVLSASQTRAWGWHDREDLAGP